MSKVIGFGHVPEREAHHFVAVVPRSQSDVQIYECWVEDEHGPLLEAANLRSILSYDRWLKIADALQDEFNRRLSQNKMKAARWKTGPNSVARLLGKELVLLSWVVEDADPEQVPKAIENWRGLQPEERWWLYTMTAAQTSHATRDRNRGWRQAIKFALRDNPVTGVVDRPTAAEQKERAKHVSRPENQGRLFFRTNLQPA